MLGIEERISYPQAMQMAPEGKTELIFNDGDSFFKSVIASVESAQHHISIESYIFDFDSLGNHLLDKLAEAAARGVRVRLLVDGVGCSHWSYDEAEALRQRGIEARIFHPLPWQKPSRKFLKSFGFRSFVFGFRKLQRRNHRKVYLFDHQTAYVGSMNVSAVHLQSVNHDRAWRDTGVQVTGSSVALLDDAFLATWVKADPPWNQRTSRLQKLQQFLSKLHPRVIINETFQERRRHHKGLIQRFGHASERIWITNPYFVPDRHLIRQLKNQAKRVDIRLILPRKTDFFGVQFAMESCYTKLIKAGVQIHTYLPSMLHAKILIVDQFVSVGSSNLDHLSLFQNYEADVVLGNNDSKQKIYDQFEKDLEKCELLTLDQWRSRPFTHKILEKLFYYCRVFL